MIQLLLASLLLFQQPPQPAPAADGWREVDGMYMIINQDTVTQRQITSRLQAHMADHAGEDVKAAKSALEQEICLAAIGTQAGETMGIDPLLIARSVHDWEQRIIDRQGGLDGYSKWLTKLGTTAEEMREQTRRSVLRQVWEESRTGKGPNQQQRVIADRYVRPGLLRMRYAQITHEPRYVGLIGGTPSKVVLQILEIDPAKVGGTALAEASATKIRARIATGASTFDEESGFCIAGSKTGEREPFDESALPNADPGLARLVFAAKDGDVLPLVPPQETIPEWRIVKLVRRIPAVVPEFEAPGLQTKIRGMIEDSLDDMRLSAARKQQFEGSYIWPTAPAGH
jgi:hypothetical protein